MKKRNKKYKQKVKCIPLGIRDNHKTEVPLLVATDCLGTDQLTIDQVTIIAEFSILVKKLSKTNIVDDVVRAITSIFDRWVTTAHLSVSPDEVSVIKAGVPVMLKFIREQSNYDVVKTSVGLIEYITRLANKHGAGLPYFYKELT